MAFSGIGGSIPLGSASARLFVDGSGMRTGLKSAQGALDDFAKKSAARTAAVANSATRIAEAEAKAQTKIANEQAKSNAKIADAESARTAKLAKAKTDQAEKVATAQKKADQTAVQARKSSVLTDPKTQQRVVDLSSQVANANANATKLIAEGYRQREIAFKALTKSVESETAKQIAAEKRLADATARQTALTKKQRQLQAALDATGKGALSAADRRTTGAAKGGVATSLKAVNAEIAAARSNLSTVQKDVANASKAMAASTTTAIRQTLDEEQKAINATRKAIGAQAKDFERFGAVAGKAGTAAANAVKKTGQEIVKSADAFHKINAAIARQQEITAGSSGAAQLKSLEKEKALQAARVQAIDRVRNAQIAYEQSVRHFSDTIAAAGAKDAATAKLAADALIAAKSTEVKVITELQIAEDAEVTRIKADEVQKMLRLQEREALGIESIKAKEAAGVVAATEAENAALNNLKSVSLGSVLSAATIATVALGGAVLATTKVFAGFDEALHNIASISKDTEFVFGEMKDKIEDLSVARGQGLEELSAALYDIVSSGFQADEALGILDASSKAAVAGMSSVANAGKSLTAVINAYKNATGELKLTWRDASKVSDVAFAAVREGVFTFEELTQQQGDNLSLAAELNVSYQELAASYVVLTRAGNNLSESTTQVNGILRTFLKPNEQLADAIDRYGESILHVSGLTGSALVQTYGFGAALEFVNQATEGSADALGKLFPNVRALRGEVGLGGRNLQEFKHQLDIMNLAFDEGTATQKAFAIQSQATAFQLRQAKQEILVAAAALGSQFAPGVLIAAKAVAFAAHQFSILPGFLQAATGYVGGFGLAVSATVVVVGNMVKAVKSGIEGFAAMAESISKSTKAMKALSIVTNPWVLAITAVSIVTFKAIQAHRAHQKAVKDLEKEYENLQKTIDDLDTRPDINASEKAQIQALKTELTGLIEREKEWRSEAERASSMTDEFGQGTVAVTTAINEQGVAVEKTVLGYKDLIDMIASFQGEEGTKRLLADFQVIFDTPELDVSATVSEIEALIDAARKTGDFDQLGDDVHDMASHTDELTVSAREAAAGEVAHGKALRNVSEFFGTADDAADNYRKGLHSLVDESLAMVGATQDMSSPLAFIQSVLRNMGDSAATTLLKLEAVGTVRFDDAIDDALKFQSALDQWQKKIDDVNASIADSQSAMSEWQNIVQLVSENVGTANNGYAQLNELLARGKISQQNYNDIKEASIFLNERAKLGIEDEHVAIVKSLPDLAAFVSAHDLAGQEYDNLSDESKGFVAALKDSNTQAIIMTATMVNLAHAMNPDEFPQSFVTTFYANISQFAPDAAAVLDQLDLIPSEIRADIIIQNTQAVKSLDEINRAILAVSKEFTRLNDVPVGERTEAQENQIVALRREWERLNKLKLQIPVEVTDAGSLHETEGAVDDLTNASESSGVAIADAFASAQADIDDAGHSVAAVIPDLLRATRAAEDLSDPFAFLNNQLHLTGKSFARVLEKAREAGKITFTGPQNAALRWQAAMDGVNAGLTRIQDSISQNESDMAMWQGRIDLVDNTIGTATDTYAQYEAQLAAGQITQEEFNKAVASGEAHRAYAELNQLVETHRITQEQADDVLLHAIHLRERSVGGILDERAETALAIIDLDNYVTKHDHLNKAYKDLNSEQKGFLAAMKDEAVQTALNTVLMLSFLEAMGQVAEGTAGHFAEMAASGNDFVAGVFEDIGLLQDGIFIPITGDATQAKNEVKEVKDDAAEGAELKVTSRGDGTGIVGPSDETFTVTADTKPAQTAVDDLTGHIEDQIPVALEHGTSEAIAYVDGFIAGINFKSTEFLGSLIYLEGVLEHSALRARVLGNNAGVSYDYGVADGVYRAAASVSGAGAYLAAVLHAAFLRGIFAKSPSRLGMEGGDLYTQGVIVGLQNSQASAAAAATGLAKSVHGAFTSEIQGATRAGVFDIASGKPIAPSQLGGRGVSSTSIGGSKSVVLHNQFGDIHVSGAGDPKAVVQEIKGEVWNELVGSMRRLESAVG